MVEHDHVGVDAHDSPGDIDVRSEQPSGHCLGQPGLQVGSVPGEGDGGLEVGMARVVEGFQVLCDSGLVFWAI